MTKNEASLQSPELIMNSEAARTHEIIGYEENARGHRSPWKRLISRSLRCVSLLYRSEVKGLNMVFVKKRRTLELVAFGWNTSKDNRLVELLSRRIL